MGFHIGHRGAAMYKGNVYLTTPDAAVRKKILVDNPARLYGF